MIKSCILLLILSHCANSTRRLDDIFNLDADDIFASEYGADFYEAQKRLQSIPYEPIKMNDTMTLKYLRKENATNLELNTTIKAPGISTTEKIHKTSISPKIAAKFRNTSLRDIKLHRLKLQLDTILSSNRSVKDYLANADAQTLTRRFDQLVAENKKKMPSKTRRGGMWFSDDWTTFNLIKSHWPFKKRALNLMTHFIYITRYKLVYPQVLRKKYYDSCVYKLGFLFSLLRHLKNMQKWLGHVLKTNGSFETAKHHDFFNSVYTNLKIVEKLQRLDVDIKDVVLLIQKMEYRSHIAYNPEFYEDSLERR